MAYSPYKNKLHHHHHTHKKTTQKRSSFHAYFRAFSNKLFAFIWLFQAPLDCTRKVVKSLETSFFHFDAHAWLNSVGATRMKCSRYSDFPQNVPIAATFILNPFFQTNGLFVCTCGHLCMCTSQ